MNNKTRKILSWFLILFVVLISFFTIPFDKVKKSAADFIDNIHDFISDINNVFTINNNSSSDHHIKNISFLRDNDSYFAVIEFNGIEASSVTSIEINNITFTEFFILEDRTNTISVDISEIIGDDESTNISISLIETNKTIHISTLQTTFYKSVNYETILEKQKSVVGISSTKLGFATSVSSAWGSGVIFNKKKVIKTNFWGQKYEEYEYLIITNYHVVENADIFDIHYGYYGNSLANLANNNIELLGVYTKHTDLAILKLTTKDGSLVAIDDDQFLTRNPVPVENNQLVFAIGSPYVNDEVMFNSYKIGQVERINYNLGQLQDSDLCKDGCHSIKTSAYQGEGSSGGGVFDIDGNLIGIHFAGNSEYRVSFEIPLELVFEAMDVILANYQVKRSHVTSFFIPLHNLIL